MLNVDGCYKEEDGSAGSGIELHTTDGQIIFSACRNSSTVITPSKQNLVLVWRAWH
jgi:hypothetical protein